MLPAEGDTYDPDMGFTRARLLWSAAPRLAGAAGAWKVGSLALAAAPLAAGCALPARTAPFNGGVLTPQVTIPHFTLQRSDGRRFGIADTAGRFRLFFFGYTLCPDVCPLTLAHVAQVRRMLGGRARHLDAYFVTVDPERDTPERLKEYVSLFDPAIVGLTGTAEELERARGAFGVIAQKRELPGSAAGYAMDHTALVYLLDGDAQLRLIYPHGMKPEDTAADLKRLLPR